MFFSTAVSSLSDVVPTLAMSKVTSFGIVYVSSELGSTYVHRSSAI